MAARKPAKAGRKPGTFVKGDPRINRTKPGPGVPPSAIRALCRGAFAERVPILAQIADGQAMQKVKVGDSETEMFVSADVSDRIKAIDQLAKYGLGTVKEVSVENVRERVSATLDVIRAHCSEEQATKIVAELRPVWA